MTYTREGDLLTIEFDGMTMVFKRSDTKPEIDPALLGGGDDEYDGDGWIDGPDEPGPPVTRYQMGVRQYRRPAENTGKNRNL